MFNCNTQKTNYYIPLIVLILFGCDTSVYKPGLSAKTDVDSYTNKSYYSVTVGDTVAIYHSTNSCCAYCLPHTEKLQHLDYIGSKIVVPEKKGCEGCNHTSVSLFVAKSIGVDTIKDAVIPALAKCSDTIKGLSNYVVRIH